jgi:hypothetical protein
MKEFKIKREGSLWSVVDARNGSRAVVPRVIIDAPARTQNSYIRVKGHVVPAGDALRILRYEKPPGKVNEGPMLEWCLAWNEGSERWVAYRQDMPSVMVTAKEVTLDCHGITSEGALHCHAEMLLNGATNKVGSSNDPKTVHLRTLRVFDQSLNVKPIKMKSKAVRPR